MIHFYLRIDSFLLKNRLIDPFILRIDSISVYNLFINPVSMQKSGKYHSTLYKSCTSLIRLCTMECDVWLNYETCAAEFNLHLQHLHNFNFVHVSRKEVLILGDVWSNHHTRRCLCLSSSFRHFYTSDDKLILKMIFEIYFLGFGCW